MMPADQAAKVLRAYADANRTHWHGSQLLPAIDAAVAALEVAASAVPEFWYIPADNDDDEDALILPNRDGSLPSSYTHSRAYRLYAAPQPAYCCAKCGLAEMHPRESALHQDAKRGNFRQEDDGA